MMRSNNMARSIQALVQQVSAFVRLSSPPHSLPWYINNLSDSDWSNSALISMAVESVTLPFRLREAGGHQASMSLYEAVLNTNGRQNIFELFAGIPQERTLHGHLESQDRSSSGHNTDTIDIDYTPSPLRASPRRVPHFFSKIECHRGLTQSEILSAATNQPADHLAEVHSSRRVVEK